MLLLRDLFLEFSRWSDTRRHRLPGELHRYLLWTPRARAANLHGATKHRPTVYLVELWFIATRVRINIVSKQELAVYGSTVRWLSVSIAIGMECRLAKVGGECRVWQPSRALLQFLHFIVQLLSLLIV